MSDSEAKSGASGLAGRAPADDAAEAIRLFQTDPQAAQGLARSALEAATRLDDTAAASMAQRALGLSVNQLGDFAKAVSHLRAAIRLGERGGHAKPAAEARMSLSLILAFRGDVTGALREADTAAEALHGADAARMQMQRAAVLQALGRMDEAEAGYQRALAGFRQTKDTLWEARCLNNRGLLNAWRGRAVAAGSDLERAGVLFKELGQDLACADVTWSLGLVAALRGDIPAALAAYDEAEAYFRRNSIVRDYLIADRCALYLSARLLPEARAAAGLAIAKLSSAGQLLQLAEVQLIASQAALLDGDAAKALEFADAAGAGFARHRLGSWQALARYASLRARQHAGSVSATELAAARKTCAALRASGWAIPALDAQLHAASLALRLGKVEIARRELAQASRARRVGPMELRIQAWHAEALLRQSLGDCRGAESALRAGLRILNQHRAALGATELRIHASAHTEQLAALGLRLATATNQPERVLAWAERCRAGALLLRPARPPQEAELATTLVELRSIVAARESAVLESRDTRELARRQAAAEHAIRSLSRRASGSDTSREANAPATARELKDALGERVLLEMVRIDGELHAILVKARGTSLHHLCSTEQVASELEALRFALRRLARGGSPRSMSAARSSAVHAAGELDRILLRPVARDLADLPLVIIPTGQLHAVPWSVLPTCSGRCVEVAPSATAWHRVTTGWGPGDRVAPGVPRAPRVVLIAGPGLPGAEAEIRALARQYPGGTALMPHAATVERATAALDGADLAHVAAHGRFRSDNPLFSSLALADGPLTVYDVERMERAPACLILSACQSGLSAVRPGDELMGLASALFAGGTRTLIASVIDVPDVATHDLMIRFHANLQQGALAGAALACVQVADAGAGPSATSAGFVCFGTGILPLPWGAPEVRAAPGR